MIFLIFIILLAGCLPRYTGAIDDFYEQRFDAAEKKLQQADCLYTSSPNSVLFSLNRAMVRFAKGDVPASLHDFQKALDGIDYYSQFSAPELAAKTLLDDSVGAYIPPPFEIALAHFYYALALLQKGEEDNATAVLYYLENHDLATPLTTYLLALLLDRRGDTSNAEILYTRIGIKREPPTTGATLLYVRHQGRSPRKVSVMAPVSIVSAAALELFLAQFKVPPALSTLTGVPVPKMYDPPGQHLVHFTKSHISYDVSKAAHDHLEKELPDIAARAAARILLRRAAVASAKKKSQPWVDLSMLFANILTQADTRSWETLPSFIELIRYDLPPGTHTVEIEGKTYEVDVHIHIVIQNLEFCQS